MSQIDIFEEIIVDNFAGGGGASTGIELATGRPVTIAINHDPDAILMHQTNHPYTTHYQESVWDIDPEKVCMGRPVGLAWFSPDCKHFSKAKGGKPVEKKIRGLAWIVLRWAGTVRPRVIMLENVEEFQTWGPVRKGKPVKSKAGQTFQKFIKQITALGYAVEFRELVAADYGAPTTRKRFFMIARCDGKPIVWPEPTHAPADSDEVKAGKKLPWRAAAEIIDWSLPCPSIFETKEQIKEQYGLSAIRPLKPNTMRRIIRGVDKFTIKSGKPFIVQCNHSGDGHINSPETPLGTVLAKHTEGIASPVIAPITLSNTGGSVGSDVGCPVHTVRTAGGQLLTAPSLMAIGQTGGGDRCRVITDPTHASIKGGGMFAISVADSVSHGAKRSCAGFRPNNTDQHDRCSEQIRPFECLPGGILRQWKPAECGNAAAYRDCKRPGGANHRQSVQVLRWRGRGRYVRSIANGYSH